MEIRARGNYLMECSTVHTDITLSSYLHSPPAQQHNFSATLLVAMTCACLHTPMQLSDHIRPRFPPPKLAFIQSPSPPVTKNRKPSLKLLHKPNSHLAIITMPQFRKGDHVEYHPIGGTASFHPPNLLYTLLKDMAMTNYGVGGSQGEPERLLALARSSVYLLNPILREASISTSMLVRTSHAMRYSNSHHIIG